MTGLHNVQPFGLPPTNPDRKITMSVTSQLYLLRDVAGCFILSDWMATTADQGVSLLHGLSGLLIHKIVF